MPTTEHIIAERTETSLLVQQVYYYCYKLASTTTASLPVVLQVFYYFYNTSSTATNRNKMVKMRKRVVDYLPLVYHLPLVALLFWGGAVEVDACTEGSNIVAFQGLTKAPAEVVTLTDEGAWIKWEDDEEEDSIKCTKTYDFNKFFKLNSLNAPRVTTLIFFK